MKKRYTEEQIIAVLREAERSGAEIRAVVRKHNISEQTFGELNTAGWMSQMLASSRALRLRMRS